MNIPTHLALLAEIYGVVHQLPELPGDVQAEMLAVLRRVVAGETTEDALLAITGSVEIPAHWRAKP